MRPHNYCGLEHEPDPVLYPHCNRKAPMPEFRSSYLIQKLDPPHGGVGILKDNPFSFGGGLKNGGLGDEAMDMIRSIWSFDYMGAAEYEFGAVPEALRELAKAKELTAFALTIPLADVASHWKEAKSKKKLDGFATVYVLCKVGESFDVEERIREIAKLGYDYTVKMGCNLSSVLRPYEGESYRPRTCGWFELSNGFFFFTDEEMWKQTCALFGVEA